MKKIIIAIAIAIAIATSASADLYPATLLVVELDQEKDAVICIDYVGFQWEFEGIEDYMINDFVSCIMYDNDTEIVFDDEIVDTQYAGRADVEWPVRRK